MSESGQRWGSLLLMPADKGPFKRGQTSCPVAETETQTSCQGQRPRGQAHATLPAAKPQFQAAGPAPCPSLCCTAHFLESSALASRLEPAEHFAYIQMIFLEGGSGIGMSSEPWACTPGNLPYLWMMRWGLCTYGEPHLVCLCFRKHTVPSPLPHALLPLIPTEPRPTPLFVNCNH